MVLSTEKVIRFASCPVLTIPAQDVGNGLKLSCTEKFHRDFIIYLIVGKPFFKDVIMGLCPSEN